MKRVRKNLHDDSPIEDPLYPPYRITVKASRHVKDTSQDQTRKCAEAMPQDKKVCMVLPPKKELLT